MPRTVDDGALCRYVLESEWFRQAKTIMAYAAIPPEVDLSPVLEAILAAGKTLIMPRCEADGMMTARRIDDLGQLTSGAYGIPEPNSDAPVVPAAEIDLILVPAWPLTLRADGLDGERDIMTAFFRISTGKPWESAAS